MPLPTMTKAQIDAIYAKAKQSNENPNELVNKAVATIGCDNAVALPWCGMWLCIETDGYTHS